MAGVSALSQKRLQDAGRYIVESLALGFPLIPWARLVWRELFFWLRYRNVEDDILGSVITMKSHTE
jgi:hypothetical protein